MPAGFASPGVLFAGNSSAPDRAFYRHVFTHLPKDKYTRYVEVGVGSFAACLVAANAGIPPHTMETSDVTLYSSIVGTLVAGGNLEDLGVTLDGEPVPLPDTDPVQQAAHLLYVQWLARMQARPQVDYWTSLVRDMVEHEDDHKQNIAKSLQGLVQRLDGVSYTPMCMWDHIAQVEDDPNAIIVAAPPTYRSGFEKFFDTGGRLTWNEPSYQIFDPATDMQRLADHMAGKKALLMFLQEDETGRAAHPTPVFAHPLGPGRTAYVISNRPEEIFTYTGGPKVAVRKPTSLTPANLPILPLDHEVTRNSTVQVIPAPSKVVDYYRNLWMHRLAAAPGSYNLLVTVDGYAAGVIGYGIETMSRPYPHGKSAWQSHIIMRFAFGAPHNTLRMTRLATMLALQTAVAEIALTGQAALFLAASRGLVTVETTRHPEIKGLRGLMKLADRTSHPDGYKLIYHAPWSHDTIPDVLTTFLEKEDRWRRTSKKPSK